MIPSRLLPALLLVLSAWAHGANPPDALRAAESGDASAQFRMGDAYFDGAGVEKDMRQALAWYRKAAEQGNREAEYQVGRMYRYGDGTAVDAAAALAWYEKAAQHGQVTAVNDVGSIYEEGSAGQTDLAAARRWYARAAQAGFGLAQRNLGRMLEYGRGGAREPRAALDWYRKAAANDDAEACWRAGNMLLDGSGVPADLVDAAHLFALGAAGGNAGAIERLGHVYLNGYGVERDPVRAVSLFRQAAALGYERARVQLAWCMEEGVGLAKDAAGAVAIYETAARHGDAFARRQLIMMLEDGRGVAADPARAAALVAAMAKADNVDGLANLAIAYGKRLQFSQARAAWEAAIRSAGKNTAGKQAPIARLLTLYAGFQVGTGRFVEAEAVLRHALAAVEEEKGPRDPQLVGILVILASDLCALDRYPEAIALLERAEAIGHDGHGDIVGAATLLGDLARAQDRMQDAEQAYRNARTYLYAAYPIGATAFADNDAKVATLAIRRGQYDTAGTLLRAAQQLHASRPQPDRRAIYAIDATLTELATQENRLDDAYALGVRALEGARAFYGPVHRDVANAMTNLGLIEVRRHRLAQAEALLAPALAMFEGLTGPDRTDAATTLQVLAELSLAQGQPALAAQQAGHALAVHERVLGAANSAVAADLDLLGQAYMAQSHFDQAQPVLARAWSIRKDSGIDAADTRAGAVRLAEVYRRLGRAPDAVALETWLASTDAVPN